MHYKECIKVSPDQEGLGEAALGVNVNHLLKVQQVRQQRPCSTFVHLRHNNLQHKNVPNITDDTRKNQQISVCLNESVLFQQGCALEEDGSIRGTLLEPL